MTKQVDIDLGVDNKSVVITFDNNTPWGQWCSGTLYRGSEAIVNHQSRYCGYCHTEIVAIIIDTLHPGLPDWDIATEHMGECMCDEEWRKEVSTELAELGY